MAEKSALKLIPGKDALLEYKPIAYKQKTYVEYQGLVYKALIDTSATFVPSEWKLIGDLREIRVNYIQDRNALTGSTPTTGTTGITIPILDNTNVLVLHAQGDPQVGADKFARYNYNKTSNTFLLLQISTGSTSSNVSNYNLLTNKPPIISGITANAGAGLTGGGVFSGGVPPNRTTFTFAHADTSSLANVNATGRTYVQKLGFDTYGHVTGATTSTWTHPTGTTLTTNNTGTTYLQNITLNNGHVVSLGTSTWVHPDTSSQGNVINTGNTVIQSINVDTDGHVIGISSATVSGGGGGGVNFSAAGDSGGAQSMPNGGTLRITGGTNISTVSSLHGANVGIRINVVAGGSNNQVQLNSSNALGGSANLTFTGGTTLVTNKLAITGVPISGSTADQFLTRNSVSGAIQRLGIATILAPLIAANGLTRVGNTIKLGGTLTGHTTIGGSSFDLFFTNRSITQNTRQAGTVGVGSSSFGDGHIVSGLYAFAEGNVNTASGNMAHAEGIGNLASGNFSHAQGNTTIASGQYSHAGGNGVSVGGKQVISSGIASFNHSQNDASQNSGDGALADNSAILGGIDHSIASGNVRAAIIGGNTIKLTGTTYIDHTVVANLAIFTTPSAGGSDDILTWNSSSKKITKITKASLLGAPVNSIQFNSGSTSFGGNAQWIFDPVNKAVTLGTRTAGTVGTNSMSIGANNIASGTSSLTIGSSNRAALNSFSGGFNTVNKGTASIAYGESAIITSASDGAVALGQGVTADGLAAIALGLNTIATGTASIAIGFGTASGQPIRAFNGAINISSNSSSPAPSRPTIGASGSWSAILGGLNHSIDVTSTGAAIIGAHNSLGTPGINLSGTSYIDTVAVSNLALFATPAGGGSDDLLTWNAVSKKINKVAQSGFNLTVNNGLTKAGTNIHLGGNLTGNTIINGAGNVLNFQQGAFLVGTTTGSTSNLSVNIGFNNSTTSSPTFVFGQGSRATNQGAFAGGYNLSAAGRSIIASGIGSFNFSVGAITSGYGANAQASAILGGSNNNVNSISSVVFGGVSNSITSNASTSTAILGGQNNTINNTVGNPSFSVIIGGQNGLIDGTTSNVVIIGGQNGSMTGNTSNSVIVGGLTNKMKANVARSVILGGQNITLTGSSQSDFAVVPSLIIWNTPGAGGSDDVLTWNAATKKVNKVTQASISDERLKQDFEPLVGVVDKINKLSSVEFKYNEKNTDDLVGALDYGLIAQEVEKVFPHVVKNNLVLDDDSTVYKTVDYKKLVPILFAAVKELSERIKILENK